MICPACYHRCVVQPPGRERGHLAALLAERIQLRTYGCTGCDEQYTFATKEDLDAQGPCDETVWH